LLTVLTVSLEAPRPRPATNVATLLVLVVDLCAKVEPPGIADAAFTVAPLTAAADFASLMIACPVAVPARSRA
jgi:hypothetical protein